MNKEDETILIDFLGENPNFFAEQKPKTVEGIEILRRLIEGRGGLVNPYGVPIEKLGGIGNIRGVVDYVSGIALSALDKPKKQLTTWVNNGLERTLGRTLKTNGNALEWYILEMLIQTRLGEIGEKGYFIKSPRELDQDLATDLLYILPSLSIGGTTLGIQVTGSRRGLVKKLSQIRKINRRFKDADSRNYGIKSPNIMSLLGIYGKIGPTVHNDGKRAFCRDLGLPTKGPQVPFSQDFRNEAKDIADFIHSSVSKWNAVYGGREEFSEMQRYNTHGRDGDYAVSWQYKTADASTLFLLEKAGNLICHFEILDAA